MGIAVLGRLEIDESAGRLGPRDRVVLSVLALSPGEVVSADRLADALWHDRLPTTWPKVVQGCVVRLRKALGSRAIETTADGYRLVLPSDEIDARRFERLVGRGRELLALGEPERADYVLGEAIALWRGPAFAELDGWEVGRVECERLEELRRDAEELRVEAELRAGRAREVVGLAQALVSQAPLRERRWSLLALAQYQAGRQSDALRTIRELRRLLAAELGLDPGPDLVALEEAILRQDPTLAVGTALPEPSQTCPYLGLVPYDVADSDGFFGRDADVTRCLRRLVEGGVLIVVGPSGSGKSSLVRAGVAAALVREGRRLTVVSPGSRPLDALTAVPATGRRPVLVVDQCEEAVTLCQDPAQRAEFFQALVAHAEKAPLVVAVRADHMSDLAAYPAFARLVERGLYLLGEMDAADLRACIEGPARQAGLLLEPGLVDLLVREVEGEPGALPLLSHTLRQTWTHREGRTLTVAGYGATGGIREAVSRTAEDVYAKTEPDQQDLVRDLMLRLVVPSPDGDPVRNRMPRRLVAADPEHDRVIERLVAARLVTSDDGVLVLAHEAVARAWPRLQAWLEEDTEGQRILRHLPVAADTWEAMGRPDSELYRGSRLAQAVEWRQRTRPKLSPVERDFVDASLAREASDLQAAQAQIRRERRTVRRLRWLTAAVAALGVLAGSSWLVAVEQRELADERSTVAEARRAGAMALVEPSYDRALLLAVEGVRLWDTPETRGNLLNTIQRSPLVAGVIRSEGARLMNLDLSPDGQRSVVVDNLEDVTVYDLGDRSPLATLGSEGRSYRAATFNPEGSRIAVSWFDTECWVGDCRDFGIKSYDARNLESTGVTYRGLGTPAADIAYSPEGDLIAAISPLPFFPPEDNIAVWQVDRPDKPMIRLSMSEVGGDPRVTPDRDLQGQVRFSPDGRRLYAGGAGPTAVFDVATGKRINLLAGAGALAVSPDGETLAVATRGTGVRLVGTATGRPTAELVGHEAAVTGAAFSHDGSLIATVSNDQTALVWDVATGERVHRLQAHVGSVHAVRFGPGLQLYTAGADGTTIQWDLDRTRGLTRQLAESGLPPYRDEGIALLSPTATSVLILAQAVALLDVGTGALTNLRSRGDVAWPAYRPDGARVATVGEDGAVQVWDVQTGELLEQAPGAGSDNAGAIAYTPDGAHIVVADHNGVLRVLDARTLEPTGRTLDVHMTPVGVRATHHGVIAVTADKADLGEGTDAVFADLDNGRVLRRLHLASWGVRANFSPDGQLYAYGGFDGRVGVIDVATGEEVARSRDPIHDGGVGWVAFSPDSQTLVSVGFDGQVTLSDPSEVVPLARVRPGEPNLRSTVAYLDDGHTLVLAYEDGSVTSLETDPAAWETHACTVAGRNLTSAEWQDAFPDREYRKTCP